MPESSDDDPVFGHFPCRVCNSETFARKSDSERYLKLGLIPECCGEHVQLIGGSSSEHKPLAPKTNPKRLDAG
jgi:hypothetical protein